MKKINSLLAALVVAAVTGCGGSSSSDPVASVAPSIAQDSAQDPAQDSAQDPAQERAAYLEFLEKNSMLFQANLVADPISGEGTQWRKEFGTPKPAEARDLASVWLFRYPLSTIPMEGSSSSVVSTWGDKEFWAAAGDLGVKLLRTNPVQRAGGIVEKEFTPTVDGFFDRIGYTIAPELGTDEQFKQLVANAKEKGATVGSDLVPTHSGLGPDFWLAAYGYKDYPGLFSMVKIPEEHWGLLPAVSDKWGSEFVSIPNARKLEELGFIPGVFGVADSDPNADQWSGWRALAPIVGADGKTRRSVYAHVFKPEQPLYNWLDPSFAAQRLNINDAANHILNRGVSMLRLDANTFLGLEPQNPGSDASIYLTPLAKVATTEIAMATRKLGGFSYQEFAGPLATLKDFAPNGPDLSYDFFTRAQALYGLINGDAQPLRLAHHFLLEAGIQSNTLIHDMQNHDEITFQMFELGSKGDFQFEGQTLNGGQIRKEIQETMQTTVGAQPYNKLYRAAQDGIATTFAGFIAPALGINDPYNASSTQVDTIRRGHLLVAHANAMIPGVFSFSEWDAVGALPIPLDSVPDKLTSGGDIRWVNRGGVDLMGTSARTTTAIFGLPEAKALYGPLPQQLQDPNSFMSAMKKMLAAREKFGIKDATMNAVPPVPNAGLAVVVMTLPDSSLAITALNYGRQATSVEVDLTQIPPGIPAGTIGGVAAVDAISGQSAGTVSAAGLLKIDLESITGRTIVVKRSS
jgi:maltose alpha-D-glucosyltransferase/alpha-amylase